MGWKSVGEGIVTLVVIRKYLHEIKCRGKSNRREFQQTVLLGHGDDSNHQKR